MREEVAKLVAEGKSREQVYEFYIAEVRQPGAARGTDRQGLQSPGLAVPVPDRRNRRDGDRRAGVPLVAPRGSVRPEAVATSPEDDPTQRETGR